MNFRVVSAIFRRNLSGYFSTPTGYVFICLFVFLCSMAAFWPSDFFSANLATLDQLNKWIAFIMLVFVPAITMSIWADERRQGTDELLLTIPASDGDVVAASFLAATGIFTISLVFSMLCNLIVLVLLSKWYLAYSVFFNTYFGYWLLGEAMLAVGMIASFLTSNLTVAFILGALFNLPLVVAQWAGEGLTGESTARFLRDWSYTGQFRDFGLGVFSLSGLVYFIGLIALSLYTCLILIGRRHWSGGRDGTKMGWHYLLRFAGLLCAIIGINALFGGHSFGRLDVSDDHVNSLSPETIKILKDLDPKQPVRVEAFFSPKLPEAYQRQRLQIEAFLREMEKASGGKLAAKIVDLEPNTEAAFVAKQRFDIVPVQRTERERSSFKNQELFMGLAFTSGLNKQVVPFVEKDLPVEYELVRAIWAVNQPKRKKIGILTTDADVMGTGGGNPMMRMQRRASGFTSLVKELRNMYEITAVSAEDVIKLTDVVEQENGEKKEIRLYDAVLAVQPSSLGPTAFNNFIQMVKSGQPTVIFEDPLPVTAQIPGTYAQKEGQRNQFGQEGPAEPKGNINELWKLLGVEQERYPPAKMAEIEALMRAQSLNAKFALSPNERDGTKILCTTPDNQFRTLGTPREVLFLVDQNETGNVFSEKSPITAGLSKIILPFAGALKTRSFTDFNYGDYRFSVLIRSGKIDGVVPAGVFQMQRRGIESGSFEEPLKDSEFVVAYEIKGSLKATQGASNLPMADEGSPEKEKAAPERTPDPTANLKQLKEALEKAPAKTGDAKTAPPAAKDEVAKIHVTIMPDLDLLHNTFFELRERTDEQIALANDNVTLVLNLIDAMAGQDQFLEIRKRGTKVRSLALLDEFIAENAKANQEQSDVYKKEIEKKVEKIQQNFTQKIGELESQLNAINPDEKPREYEEKERQLAIAQKTLVEDAQAEIGDLQRENKGKIDALDRKLNTSLESERQKYQYLALLLPPIPPLCVAFFVFFNRRMKEKEGHRKSRLL